MGDSNVQAQRLKEPLRLPPFQTRITDRTPLSKDSARYLARHLASGPEMLRLRTSMVAAPSPAPASPGNRLLHWIRVLLAGGAFAGFGLGAPLVGLVLPLVWLIGPGGIHGRQRCQRVVAGTFRFFHAYMRWVGLIDYAPDLQLPPRDGPRVIIANHPTLVDVTALLSAYPEACCAVKSTIYNNPLFFFIMKFCGHIRVDRNDKSAGAAVIEQAASRVSEGSDLLLFPEGTRSPVDDLGPFHAGAFAVAVHCEIPVAPVAIICSKPVLKRGTPWYLIPPEPVTLELKSLGHLQAKEDEAIQTLSDRVRNHLLTSLIPS